MKKTLEKSVTEKKPQRLRGSVVQAGKMIKTITVKVNRLVWHKKLHKQFSRSKKYLVHDEKSEGQIGDKVVIEKCRPLSAKKNFRLISREAKRVAAQGETP